MISGIYFVRFAAGGNDFGEGLVVIRDGNVNGGDETYLYRGRLDVYGEDVRAHLEIKHYRGSLNSVMGPLQEFTLQLSGKASGDRFEVSGGIPDMPSSPRIIIHGNKVSELFE
ncbi:MAG: hypothetical protein H6926_04765 [Chromatiales bacterium]|nr:hypothetical protein [Chromatiales bacterium]